MHIVYTMGYEGTDIDRFVATLKAVGVKTLADVRAVAISRKKGFSKTALQARLSDEDIEYAHFVELGDPKPGRDAARAGRLDTFRKIYARHLARNECEVALKLLADLVSAQPTCLLCFERDPAACHRSMVANRLTVVGAKVIHLCADDPDRYVLHAAKLHDHHPRQGASAA